MGEAAGPEDDGLASAGPGVGFVDVEATDWYWLYADEAGVEVSGPPVSFSDQISAENWLRDNFDELQDMGVVTVSLMDGERAFYGPMFLAPEAPGPEPADSTF